ncbi:hypothetical protein PUNSTDRAFT_112311 [Punctularia strigosozonata HHB-11173 SS5]|uniref:uncharacterized protein n=1 Tax=Punctularia strigosozonata (strain HHB-11173) TaxID=741275 RepID=UPI0004416700|nr:uncharacterized protein PUNSTDRAFT_112311 [Punctularia strigosozonata HHB-11173 SS5]EIN10459.1 hypothetical protein PUNSTDRAFT_112311 [Punctularia strigosozonata HHB-11173 SS5]
MRRLASVFRKGSTRSDRSDAVDSQATDESAAATASTIGRKRGAARFFTSSSRINISTEPSLLPPPLVRSNQASSSASSYEDSLRTPEDDGLQSRLPSPTPNLAKKAWRATLMGRKSGSAESEPQRAAALDATPRAQDWRPRQPPPLREPPPLRAAGKTSREGDSDDDSSTDSEDSYDQQDVPTPTRPTIAIPRESAAAAARANLGTAARNLSTFTASTMTPPIYPPPLLHLHGMPLFPRSVNPSSTLVRADSLESRLHKTRLLRRLERRDLSAAEERSIAPFAAKHGTRKRPSFHLDEASFSNTRRIRSYSQGLQRWADRPCFEDRVTLWTTAADDPSKGTADGDLIGQRVIGRPGYAVASLEFSMGLEALAGLAGDFVPEYEPASSASSSSSQLPATVASRAAGPFKTGPSPLRIEHSPPAPRVPAHTANLHLSAPLSAKSQPSPASSSTIRSPVPSSSTSPLSPDPAAEAAMPAPARQGVRFAPETKDVSESIPLGYALKARKAKEDKAKFLKEERERRALEEERRKMEEERRKMEEDKLRFEKEKREFEEERSRQRRYADEVAAARKRQSMSRTGLAAGPGPSSFLPDRRPPAPDRGTSSGAVSQASDRRSFEPMPPRRQASEPAVTTMRAGDPSPARNPPSTARHSVYLTGYPSADDVRTAPGSASRRSSMVSSSAAAADAADRGRVRSRKTSAHSNTSSSGRPISMMLNTNVPPVPPMPMMAMPGAMYTNSPVSETLLPPSAPFMMQSYGPRSRNSSRGSGSRDSDRRSGESSPGRNSTSGSSSGSRRPRPGQSPTHLSPHPRLPSSQSSDRVNAVPHSSGSSQGGRPGVGMFGTGTRSYSFQDPRMAMAMPMNPMAQGMGMYPMGMQMTMSPSMPMVGGWGMPMAQQFVQQPGMQPAALNPALATPGKGRQSTIF